MKDEKNDSTEELMNRLRIPEPISAGLILSYKCEGTCKHCMYACSPFWRADWLTEEGAELILKQLVPRIKPSPYGREGVSVNHGLHFTGGEPFLNFNLLLKTVELAHELRIPSTFIETNCFWCINDHFVREKLTALREAGLNGILISVNPFLLEHVPFERIERAINISKEIFGENTMIYQEIYYHRFRGFAKGTLTLDQFLERDRLALRYAELLPMGRACYMLKHFFAKYPSKAFFGESCMNELTRNWHVHIDNYFNYMAGYCGGISLGDARDLNTLTHGIDLEDRPIIRSLITDIKNLYELSVKEFNYKEKEEGYISKCHLCIDVRRHIVQQTSEFKELQPRELYYHLEESLPSPKENSC